MTTARSTRPGSAHSEEERATWDRWPHALVVTPTLYQPGLEEGWCLYQPRDARALRAGGLTALEVQLAMQWPVAISTSSDRTSRRPYWLLERSRWS